VFCGALVDVLTALEVRRKVCVAPLGLRALEVEMVSTHAARCLESCAAMFALAIAWGRDGS
jgi:hypothetical protein